MNYQTQYPRMSPDEFKAIVEDRINQVRQILIVKAEEYARNGDSLHNFHEGAVYKRKHPLRILDDYNTKHLVSFFDLLRDVEAGKIISEQTIKDKIGDIVAYFLIAEPIIIEHNRMIFNPDIHLEEWKAKTHFTNNAERNH